jgi:hypothetical protein
MLNVVGGIFGFYCLLVCNWKITINRFGQTYRAKTQDEGVLDEDDIYDDFGRFDDSSWKNKMVKFNDTRKDEVDFTGYDVVTNLGDVEYLPTSFSAAEFERLFLLNHYQSNVSVDRVISYIYIIRHYMENWELLHTKAAQRIQTLL